MDTSVYRKVSHNSRNSRVLALPPNLYFKSSMISIIFPSPSYTLSLFFPSTLIQLGSLTVNTAVNNLTNELTVNTAVNSNWSKFYPHVLILIPPKVYLFNWGSVNRFLYSIVAWVIYFDLHISVVYWNILLMLFGCQIVTLFVWLVYHLMLTLFWMAKKMQTILSLAHTI